MTLNRVVALLTPLLFAPLAGAVAAWLAEHFPGFQVDKSALEEVFIAGALIALAPAAQWLHGWQKFEAREAELERDVALADATVEAGAAVDEEGPAEALAGEEEEPELDEPSELEELSDLDELSELDELSHLDELADLEELAEMDAFDEQLLSENGDPALAGG